MKTTYLLTMITVVDLLWGSKGIVSLTLWIGYGMYKTIMTLTLYVCGQEAG